MTRIETSADAIGDGETEAGLLDLIVGRARSCAAAVALRWDGGTMTYGRLDALSDRLAAAFAVRGIGPENLVGVFLGRGPKAVVAMLAVLKVGGVYLPLDSSLPHGRLAHIVADSAPRVVVVLDHDDWPLPAIGGTEVVPYDDALRAVHQATPCTLRRNPEALAYVVYTSGSTGTPKGIALSWRTLGNVLRWDRWRGDGPRSCLHFASVGFDVSILEVIGSLSCGGVLTLIEEHTRRDPERLLALLARDRIDTVHLPPAMLGLLAEVWVENPIELSLRHIMVSGDVFRLTPACRRLLEGVAPETLENQYGPSETHHATSGFVDVKSLDHVTPVIGYPITGVRIRLLDAWLNHVPPGIRGEVYIAGDGVGRGYLNLPGMTAERFVADTHGAPGNRMFRTGDLARWDRDDGLVFLSRDDEQVSVRGFRVELGEVEAVLATHPAVRSAVVTVESGALVGYAVAEENATFPSGYALGNHLRGRLPVYMIPPVIHAVPTIPLTANGKVDRVALARGHVDGERLVDRYMAPSTWTEQIVAEVWSRLLGADRVGIDDNFFALGGHSVLATQAVSRLRRALDRQVTVRDLFEWPTVRMLAASLAAVGRVRRPPIEHARDGPAPCSSGQRRMWLFSSLAPDSVAYNVTSVWSITGPVDVDAVRRVLTEIVRRHEILRTTFPAVDGEPVQLVTDDATPDFGVIDLTDPGRIAEDLARHCAEVTRRRIDLVSGPLVRMRMYRAGETSFLAFHFHHIVIDGWSMDVLWAEFASLYDAFAAGLPSPLGAPALQYGDYARWQQSCLNDEVVTTQTEFWRAVLAGAPDALELPTDRPRPRVPSGRGGRLRFTMPSECVARLREVGHSEDATLFMVMLTVFQILLARYGGVDDVVVGTPISAREDPDTEWMIGFFANTVPLRLAWSGDPTFGTLLARQRSCVLAAHAHQDVPFDKVVASLAPAREPGRHPVFQAVFTLSEHNEPPAPAGWTVREVPVETGYAPFDVVLQLEKDGPLLSGFFSYSPDLFDEDTVSDLVDCFLALCERVAADPDTTTSVLTRPGDAERDRLVVEFNRTPPGWVVDGGPRGWIMDAVAANPDGVAVVWAGGSMTYRELDTASTRLARYLMDIGVGPEVVVGVCLGRGVEQVIALVAVIKAGGVYLPLDHTLPAERLAIIVVDAGAATVVHSTSKGAAVAGLTATAVDYDRDGPAIASRLSVPIKPRPDDDPDQLLYVVYTSGSTGRPKGVALPGRTLATVLRWELHRRPGPRECVQFAAIGFDLSLMEIIPTLVSGGTLTVVVDDDVRRDPARYLRLMAERRIDTAYFTPALLDQVARAWANDPIPLSLTDILIAGDTLTWSDDAVDLLAHLPDVVVLNGYGPSETHGATATSVGAGERCPASAPPIGRPMPGVRVYVLDGRLNPTPVRVRGELYIAGTGVGRGYLNLPGLTATRFLADPFGAPGERMYRTGDLGLWTPEGQLEFHGRADDQLSVRGFRVEPGEIESVLMGHPEVRAAAVVLATATGGDRRLVAYVIPAADHVVDPAELRARLLLALPRHMIPGVMLSVPALPLSVNGKVDRAALTAWPVDIGPEHDPRTLRESVLAEIYADVLGVPAVDTETGFFELGGHSLLVPSLVGRVRAALGVDLPVRRLFDSPSVAELAASIGSEATLDGLRPLLPIRESGSGVPLFCVAPATGISWCYAPLAHHPELDRPLYGLQDPALSEPAPTGRAAVGELAERFVAEMRAVCPEGPYHLLGWSFGGVVAHEMAVRLKARGQHVSFLGVMDGYPASPDDVEPPEPVQDHAAPQDQTSMLRRLAGLRLDLGAADTEAVFRAFRRNVRAMAEHISSVFDGEMTVFIATEDRGPQAPAEADWMPFVTGEVHRVDVRCAHLEMTEARHLRVVADELVARTATEEAI
jgi:amino acid adenylation domain-containing protein